MFLVMLEMPKNRSYFFLNEKNIPKISCNHMLSSSSEGWNWKILNEVFDNELTHLHLLDDLEQAAWVNRLYYNKIILILVKRMITWKNTLSVFFTVPFKQVATGHQWPSNIVLFELFVQVMISTLITSVLVALQLQLCQRFKSHQRKRHYWPVV